MSREAAEHLQLVYEGPATWKKGSKRIVATCCGYRPRCRLPYLPPVVPAGYYLLSGAVGRLEHQIPTQGAYAATRALRATSLAH